MIWFSNSRNCQKISPCFQCYWLEAERLLHSRLRCQPIFQACMYGLGRWRKKRLKPLMIRVLAAELIHHRRPRSRFFGGNPQIVSRSEIDVWFAGFAVRCDLSFFALVTRIVVFPASPTWSRIQFDPHCQKRQTKLAWLSAQGDFANWS